MKLLHSKKSAEYTSGVLYRGTGQTEHPPTRGAALSLQTQSIAGAPRPIPIRACKESFGPRSARRNVNTQALTALASGLFCSGIGMSELTDSVGNACDDEDRKAFLDWVEEQAAENMRFHAESAAVISKEANSTLTVLLAGAGGASAYTVKLLDTHGADWLLAATVTFGVCLLLLCAYLILGCLKIDEMPTPTNEPANLYLPSYKLVNVREAEIENAQQRIRQIVERNNKTADRLNRIRLYAVTTPVISAVVAAVAAAEYF
jgi:hypothetical protein